MNRGLVLEFTKMHGAGNDFIVIDNRFFYFTAEELSEIARKFCVRHFGVGADGLLALEPPRTEGHHFHMTYMNADGSPGAMCGNGARCLARFAFEAGIESSPLRFGTTSGEYRALVNPSDHRLVRVLLPAPSTIKPNFSTVRFGEQTLSFAFVETGVPHAVWFGGGLDDLPAHDWGSTVRNHPDFASTNGTNVDFVEVQHDDHGAALRVRSYERGVEAETLACGTGALSSFAAAKEAGLVDSEEATVTMRGGILRVGYTPDGKEIFLEGPAENVFRGTLTL